MVSKRSKDVWWGRASKHDLTAKTARWFWQLWASNPTTQNFGLHAKGQTQTTYPSRQGLLRALWRHECLYHACRHEHCVELACSAWQITIRSSTYTLWHTYLISSFFTCAEFVRWSNKVGTNEASTSKSVSIKTVHIQLRPTSDLVTVIWFFLWIFTLALFPSDFDLDPFITRADIGHCEIGKELKTRDCEELSLDWRRTAINGKKIFSLIGHGGQYFVMNQILKSLLKPRNPWEGMYGETPDALRQRSRWGTIIMRLRGLRVMRIPIRHIYGPLRNLRSVIIVT